MSLYIHFMLTVEFVREFMCVCVCVFISNKNPLKEKAQKGRNPSTSKEYKRIAQSKSNNIKLNKGK